MTTDLQKLAAVNFAISLSVPSIVKKVHTGSKTAMLGKRQGS